MPDLGAVLGGMLTGDGAQVFTGTVQSVSSGYCTVYINGGFFPEVPYMKGNPPAVGELVYILAQRNWGMAVIGRPEDRPYRDPYASQTEFFIEPTVMADWVADSPPRWSVSTDAYVHADTNRAACWFYDAADFATLPDPALISSFEFLLSISENDYYDPANPYSSGILDVVMLTNNGPVGTYAVYSPSVFRQSIAGAPGTTLVSLPLNWLSLFRGGFVHGIALDGPMPSQFATAFGPGNLRIVSL